MAPAKDKNKEGCKQFGRLFEAGTLSGLSDAQLLEQFATGRDELAFEVLVTRHGPLVLAVCRRILADAHDAEDAFQASFLVLARKARTIRSGANLGAWLCRVAYRISLRAGVEAVRREQNERRVATDVAGAESDFDPDRPGPETVTALYEELDRLPERYRVPVVLCHLEGMTTEAAAARLGCPVGTVWGRLSRARTRLRSQLIRRGVTLSAGLLTVDALLPPARAAISTGLIQETARTALKFAALDALAAGVTSAQVARLTRGALKGMIQAQLKTTGIIVLAAGLIAGAGAGVLSRGQHLSAANASALAAAGQKTADPGKSPEPRGRTLRFPGDRALGIIYVHPEDAPDLTSMNRYDLWKRIGDARGLVALPAKGLVRLDVSKAALADLSPLEQLAPESIQVLSFHDLAATDEALRHVGHFTGLKKINLGGNYFTGRGLRQLGNLVRLMSIGLADSTIDDEGIRAIAHLKSLRSIGLYRSRITDQALELIGAMPQLEGLDLGQTSITDRGVAHLGNLKNLRYLWINNTNTTDSALETVAKLVKLDDLEFDATRATDVGLASLAPLKVLKSIRAYGHPFTDVGLARLAKLPALERLQVGNGTRFTDQGLATMSRCRSLKLLHLSRGRFTDGGLASLAELPQLEDLHIGSDTKEFTDRGMEQLGRLKTLKKLWLSGCMITGVGLDTLGRLLPLEALLLEDTSLTF